MQAKTPLRNSNFFTDTEVESHSTEILENVREMVTLGSEPPEFHEFERAFTMKIKTTQGLHDAERGSRVNVLLHITVSRKLLPITTLTGDQFLAAWWQIVTSHRALWKRGVRHCAISPSNCMGHHLGGQFIAVFIDFDLSSTKQDGPSGFECIGTLPFMALNLLTSKAIAGDVEHVYRHDAESFIWVLTWICLRYDNGKLLRKNRPLDEWLTVDTMIRCPEKKSSFTARLLSMNPTPSNQKNFDVAMQCLAVIHTYAGPFASVSVDDEVVFNTLLQNHVPRNVLQGHIL
ncbi:hypothetical protein EDD22DRAFT_951695 [Suillus occidentalis]|nr:hypothetical protein EDD22DRAFT_951695 [Suillus occidentalis]